jgi:hypothetical protein
VGRKHHQLSIRLPRGLDDHPAGQPGRNTQVSLDSLPTERLTDSHAEIRLGY